jgi:hypothetical protein
MDLWIVTDIIFKQFECRGHRFKTKDLAVCPDPFHVEGKQPDVGADIHDGQWAGGHVLRRYTVIVIVEDTSDPKHFVFGNPDNAIAVRPLLLDLNNRRGIRQGIITTH